MYQKWRIRHRKNSSLIKFDGYSCFRKGRIIHGIKGLEFLGIVFLGPVSTEQLIIEINTYFRYHCLSIGPAGSNFLGGNDVLPRLSTNGSNRMLVRKGVVYERSV